MTKNAMRVVVIGANGQLGTDLVKAMADWDVVPLTRSDLDICDYARTRKVLQDKKAEIVINTAAYNRVDDCEDEVDRAFAVNAFAVRNLAQICDGLECVFVHISTNYVFDGRKREPYTEDDLPNPLSVYGVSKLAGEYFARISCADHLIIRTSGLFGSGIPGGADSNFVERIIRLAESRAAIRVVDDQLVSPSYTQDVAGRIGELLQAGQRGTFHVTNSGSCSWFEFARGILRLARASCVVEPVSSIAYGARARRPLNGVLANDAVERLGFRPLRTWEAALTAYMLQRERDGILEL
ncbi:MAG TPA: dTDP-4-dehydrorhamnose reductase [Candidatus Bipolaricaulis anaerobius]|nr:dTDP-4-dehydrorhamnose reductase [Candidatus Bipolaricaulis anaerobius]HNS24033.1 dTDP-4-dehydrorhamnose reductase [Candidatus Bipolaricaulis anaerobius]